MGILLVHTDGPVAVVTLNRPEARNAVNAAVAQGFADDDTASVCAVLERWGNVKRSRR